MNAEPRPAKTAPARRKPTGKAPAWALKLGAAVISVAIFAGTFDHAISHLSTANAPLQPAVVAVAAAEPTATTSPTVTLSPSVSTTTRTPVTKTASS
jgi:hypothetical protein